MLNVQFGKKIKNNDINRNKIYSNEITDAIMSCMSPIFEKYNKKKY